MAASVYGITHYSQPEGVRQYVRENPRVGNEIWGNVERGALDGLWKGAALGGLVGSLLAASPLGPTTVSFGLFVKYALGGATIGGLAGGVAKGAGENNDQWTIVVPNSAAFLNWKAQTVIRGFSTVINNHIGDQNLLDFVCPITLDIIVVPVIDPYGHTYERAAIEQSLRERGHRSPLTRQPLNPEQLVANYAYHRNLLPALQNIGQGNVPPFLKEGIQKYDESVRYLRRLELANLTQRQTERLVAGEITTEQFAENCARIVQQLAL